MLYLLAFLAIFALDQWVKWWVVTHLALYETAPLIPGFVELRYIQNTGGGWSILSEHTWLLSLLTAAIMAAILILLFRKIVRHRVGLWACSLLLAGGAGNLLDRIRLGYVVDMFNFQFINYPVFNVADIAVVGGIILGAIYYLFLYDKHDARQKEDHYGSHHSDSGR